TGGNSAPDLVQGLRGALAVNGEQFVALARVRERDIQSQSVFQLPRLRLLLQRLPTDRFAADEIGQVGRVLKSPLARRFDDPRLLIDGKRLSGSKPRRTCEKHGSRDPMHHFHKRPRIPNTRSASSAKGVDILHPWM